MITVITKLHEVFKGIRIAGLVGNKNTGKTNNICQMIVEYRETEKKVPIYVYGLPEKTLKALEPYNVKEISSLDQLVEKKRCIVVLDEFQKLKLNDRRNKDELNELVDFIYHNNVYLLLSSPNIREFNSVIGGVIERWLLKSVSINQCINGSQLKKVITDYKGRHKLLGSISLSKSDLLLINNDYEQLLHCPYFKEADSKLENKELF
jgi:hypothetical protein